MLGNLPVFRSIVEIEVPRDVGKVTGDEQKALAGVLDTFRIGKGESLFKKKGEDFGRKIAQIPIATPYASHQKFIELGSGGSGITSRLRGVK